MSRNTVWLSRRRFLQISLAASGALMVGVRAAHAREASVPPVLLGENFTRLGPYLRIEPDGRIIIGARAPDCGEGTRTSLPRIIADELDADWSMVSVVPLGPAVIHENNALHWRYGRQLSGESANIPAAWDDLRQAGALARWLLLQAAAAKSGTPASRLRASSSNIITPGNTHYGYGELVKAAAKQAPPQTPPPLKTPDQFTLIGRGAGDVDAESIVSGRMRYAVDHSEGDMLTAVIVHCPYLDGSLDSIDTSATLKVPGVAQVLQVTPAPDALLGQTALAPGVAVLAEDMWSAMQGREALKLTWKPSPKHADESTRALEKQARALLKGDSEPTARPRHDGDPDTAFKKARWTLQSTYVQPMVAHADAETMNCLVRIESDHATLVVPTQAPQETLSLVQKLTGLSPDKIDINVPRVGGGLGRRLDQDMVAEAVMLAKAAKKPVKLVWTRDQDFMHDVYRPGAVHTLSAALDRHKHFTAWRQHKASPSMLWQRGVAADRLWTSEVQADALPAGLIPNFETIWFGLDSDIPRGETRAGSHTVNTFAEQCFLDEVARHVRVDPLQLRLDLLGKTAQQLPYRDRGGAIDTGRLSAVLTAVAERIGWHHPPRNGHGLGIAFHYIYGGYCAHAFEVSVHKRDHTQLIIHRVVCAVDVGRVVNPTGLEAIVTGATLDGISTALGQRISVDKNQVQQHGYKDYPMARMAQVPRKMEVISMPSDAPPTGATGIAMPSSAPALANAVYAATTVRIRRLPLMPELLRLL